MLSKVHSPRRNLYDPFAIYDSYYTPSKRNCQVLIDFINITFHNFLKKTSFLDHHQYSQSEVNIGGDPVA